MEAFAKRLVDSDGSVRDKAFKGLQAWLEGRASKAPRSDAVLSEREALRLWKALFYCMWMADRPSYQLTLAGRLGDLGAALHRVSPPTSVAYVRGFWVTLCREWPGLDRHRLDKYYNLVRRFVALSAEVLASSEWDYAVADAHALILRALPLSTSRSAAPDGLRLFMLEAAPAVLAAALGDRAVPENGHASVLRLFAPFFDMLAESPTATVVQAAGRDFFPELAKALPPVLRAALGRAAFARGEGDVYAPRNRTVLYEGGLLLKASEADK